jgi:hypothetical protein
VGDYPTHLYPVALEYNLPGASTLTDNLPKPSPEDIKAAESVLESLLVSVASLQAATPLFTTAYQQNQQAKAIALLKSEVEEITKLLALLTSKDEATNFVNTFLSSMFSQEEPNEI